LNAFCTYNEKSLLTTMPKCFWYLAVGSEIHIAGFCTEKCKRCQ